MKKHTWFEKPVLRLDENKKIHRKVSWLELFFDLFFVVVISRLAHNLANNITADGIIEFVLLFIPTWWVWIGITYYNERFETGGLGNRLFIFLTMIPTAGLAIFAYHGLHENFIGFSISYAIARILNIFMWLWGGYHNKVFNPVTKRFVTGFSIAVILVIASIFFDLPIRLIIFGTAVFIDIFTPTSTIPIPKLPKFSSSRLPERYGLFVIIVLGETIIGVIQGLSNLAYITFDNYIYGLLCIIIGIGIWWMYFDFIGRRAFKIKKIWTFIWSYLHLPLLMGIVAIGAGILNIVERGNEITVDSNVGFLFVFSFAGVLIILGLLELTLRKEKRQKSHPIVSALLKILSGLSGIGLIVIYNSINTILLLIIFIGLIFMQILYNSLTIRKK